MKNLIKTIYIFLIAVLLIACNSEKKEQKAQINKEKKSSAVFVLDNAKNSVEWTAYKTTEKVPVKGRFKKVEITSGGEGNSVKEAIHNSFILHRAVEFTTFRYSQSQNRSTYAVRINRPPTSS